jgi:hypothetical protein
MTENELIILHLDQAFHRRSWHGTNLLGSIRGLEIEEAVWRPKPPRHNIWEIIVHTAYWKYTVYRRLVDERKGSFPLKGSNWFARPEEKTERALKADIKLLKSYHEKLIEAVRKIKTERLGEIPEGSKFTYRDLAIGVGAHDLYHAGQIQLIKRLMRG